ncbi:MAG: NADPH-dependent oxidoreductase [Alphaproteobacteria bacterium]|nr:NADPH-dependent oxidoreductase [Alphaproteobacteria bacterium]
MQIAIVSGSHRPNGQSGRIARWLQGKLGAIGATGAVIDLAGNPLPLWDESVGDAGSALAAQWAPYAETLRASDGFVIVSPEWHGMAPAGLKNFFLYCKPQDVGHKPALIVGVSASRGGAYPVSELRESSYKNSRILYIPEHLIVRDAAKMLVGDEPAGSDDAYLRERAVYTLKLLLSYAAALKPVRASDGIDYRKYSNGM